MDRRQMLWNVSAQQFAAFDTQLYLDTHPYDKTAMMLFNNLQNAYMEAASEYEHAYGPLDSRNAANGTWEWINDPWPWEREAN